MNVSDLITRLEEAEGPSRRLDDAIYDMLLHVGFNLSVPGVPFAPQYTSSVDVAIALAERVLPGWRIGLWTPKNGTKFEGIVSGNGRVVVGTHDAGLALALVIAVLKAKESETS